MMKKLFAVIFTCVLLFYSNSCNSVGDKSNSPKLVVLIAIDGLGSNMLNRYNSVFKGGFLRLNKQGMHFENAVVDHGITVSHAGHVTLSTGNHPAKHGIVDAAFYVPKGNTRVLVDAVADTTEMILGESESNGVSPRKILTPGLGEWIKEADQNSRSLSIGSGYISSLLYSSTSPGDVYWYSRSSGRYVTSTYYRKKYPEWVNKFNNDTLNNYKNSSKNWECIVPQSFRNLAREDGYKYEADGIFNTFPHIYEKELAENIPANKDIINTWFAWTPVADAATLTFAKTGIKALLLGQRSSTDYLSIVLSQIDNVCHYYGPSSLEALDAIMRLDDELGKFFTFLDETVGDDNYIIAVSSDHGFPEIPEYRNELGKDGKRIKEKEIEKLLDDIENSIGDSSVFSKGVTHKVVELLKKNNFVADAYSPKEMLSRGNTDDDFIRLYRNSYREDRVPRLPLFSLNTFESVIGKTGVMVRLKEGNMINLDVVIHGSPYVYDRRVPVYFLGAGVDAYTSLKSARTVDVAPTLAYLAGIKYPNNLDGNSLIELK